jgi:myo-inositol-1(or 4)-monophosphatase
MKPSEQRKALAAAVRAARAAGKLMRLNLRKAKVVNTATAYDIKLELDVRCQRLIESPQIAVLGEEGDSGAVNEEYRWVVDPIDGTVNFAYGIPHACVSIALQGRRLKSKSQSLKSGKAAGCDPQYASIVGVILDPFQDELWTAIRGGPARLNGRVIHVSQRRELKGAIVSMGFGKTRENLKRGLPQFAWLVRRVRRLRMMGAAALGLAYVASGRYDAYLERSVSLWDVAAGALIVECAGGRFWTEPIRGRNKLRMLASNGLIHDKLPLPR